MYFISVWTPGRVAAAKVVANGDPNKQQQLLALEYTDRWHIEGKTEITDWRNITNASASIQDRCTAITQFKWSYRALWHV